MISWQIYEQLVLNYFLSRFPNARIERNVKLRGRFSETEREIDILLSTTVFGCSMQVAIECKNWATKLDAADIDLFIGKLNDLGISKGIVVSKKGYSEPAYKRARAEIGIQLQVLDFESLPSFHNFWANPYRGNVGAVLNAPNGWLVNIRKPSNMRGDAICTLYPFEFDANEAYSRRQFMYFNINLVVAGVDLTKLLAEQDDIVMSKWPKSKIDYWQEKYNQDGTIQYRKIEYPERAFSEFTGGLQLDDFFVYCVCIVPLDYKPDDFSRLQYVMNELTIVRLAGVDPDNSHDAWTKFLIGDLENQDGLTKVIYK
jgi:hypothetical protein